MKALSLLQPWASLVVLGHKKIETRGWATDYRGLLLIHASSGKKGALVAQLPVISQYIPDFKALPFGAIIGEARLVDVVRLGEDNDAAALSGITLEEGAFGTYTAGRWGWVLEDAVAYDEPIPAKGRLGLWEW